MSPCFTLAPWAATLLVIYGGLGVILFGVVFATGRYNDKRDDNDL